VRGSAVPAVRRRRMLVLAALVRRRYGVDRREGTPPGGILKYAVAGLPAARMLGPVV
jgi:hypothetical protein